MDINTIRNRLSKIIRDIQYEKIEIMKAEFNLQMQQNSD